MPRHPRLFVSGAAYHVYCRVVRGEFVFDGDVEADGFVETVRKVRDLDDWRILAWVLMGNHYHLVVKTDSVPLLSLNITVESEGLPNVSNSADRGRGRRGLGSAGMSC